MFWLAHSQHQAGDLLNAVSTVADLEQKFPSSRWVKPARSLRVELAQKLRREDVLWFVATTAPPPAAAPPPGWRPAGTNTVRPLPEPDARSPRPAPMPPAAAVVGAPPASPPHPAPTARPAAPVGAGGRRPAPPPAFPNVWVSELTTADTDLRIQALGSLMQTDAKRVIPILREIALTGDNPAEASRAVFVLAQSGRPEAHTTVLEVARTGPESVSVAAVKELGRFGGPRTADDLLKVYEIGKPRVKYQVVNALGERAATQALYRIVQTESDSGLRNVAIVTLGRAGGREQLQRLYRRAPADAKRPIITGLFNARAENELIAIAERETDPVIRREVLARLRLLGTPKAKEYLEKTQSSR
jgi:HEAT repeat protein